MASRYDAIMRKVEQNKPVEDIKYSFGSKSKVSTSDYKLTPLFGYDFIAFGKTAYCFAQACLDTDDIQYYYQTLNKISKTSINDLVDKSHHSLHFHILAKPNAILLELYKSIIGKEYIPPELLPIFGQFALYTSTTKADRNSGIKSPRIIFILGPMAVLYILFYDPYHEIYSATK